MRTREIELAQGVIRNAYRLVDLLLEGASGEQGTEGREILNRCRQALDAGDLPGARECLEEYETREEGKGSALPLRP